MCTQTQCHRTCANSLKKKSHDSLLITISFCNGNLPRVTRQKQYICGIEGRNLRFDIIKHLFWRRRRNILRREEVWDCSLAGEDAREGASCWQQDRPQFCLTSFSLASVPCGSSKLIILNLRVRIKQICLISRSGWRRLNFLLSRQTLSVKLWNNLMQLVWKRTKPDESTLTAPLCYHFPISECV